MPLTPETLTRHELNGLRVRVVDARNADLVGIAGRIVVETMRTLHVDCGSRVRQVPKRGTTFEFALGRAAGAERDERLAAEQSPVDEAAETRREPLDDSSGHARRGRKTSGTASKRSPETPGVRSGQSAECEGAAYVTVDGEQLLSRPALRTEHTGDSQWR
jgi:ribonuclease P protein subunit POP4